MGTGGSILGGIGGAIIGGIAGWFVGGPAGAFYGATIGFGIGFGAAAWVNTMAMPNNDEAEKNSPNYGFGDKRNVYANDVVIPYVAGRVEMAGAIVYQGGEVKVEKTSGVIKYVNPAPVHDFMVAWGEGPLTAVFDVAADGVKFSDMSKKASTRTYLGSATQNADSRFDNIIHYYGIESGEVWNYTSDSDLTAPFPAAKVITFQTSSLNTSTTYAWVEAHLRCQMSMQLGDNDGKYSSAQKFFNIQIEYSTDGAAYVDAGIYRIKVPKSEYGFVDVYIPIGDPTRVEALTIDVVQVGETTVTYDDPGSGTHTVSEPVYEDVTVDIVKNVTVSKFAAPGADRYLRFTIDDIDVPNGDVIEGNVTVMGVNIHETYEAQAFRYTGYNAITVPRKDLQSNSPDLTAIVLGPRISVWTGAAFETKWSNNPIWHIRNLLTNSRYGVGLDTSQIYDGPDAVTWGGFKMAAAACDTFIGTPLDTLTTATQPADIVLFGNHFRASDKTWIVATDTVNQWKAGVFQADKDATVAWVTDSALGLSVVASTLATIVFAEGDEWSLQTTNDVEQFSNKANFKVSCDQQFYSYSYTGADDTNADYSGYYAGDGTNNVPLLHHDVINKRIYVEDELDNFTNLVLIKEQRFRFDYAFDAEDSAINIIQTILSHCRGMWWEDGGTMRVGVERASVAMDDVDYSDMISGSFSYGEEESTRIPDTVIATYVDQDRDWKKKELVYGENLTGGLVERLDWLGCVNWRQATRLAFFSYGVAGTRVKAQISLPLMSTPYEPGDILQLATPVGGMTFGYNIDVPDTPVLSPGDEKDFVIISIEEDLHEDIRSFVLREHDTDIYSDDPGIEILPDPRDSRPLGIPDPVENLKVTSLGDLTDDGIVDNIVRVSWVQPSKGTVAFWRIWQSRDGGTDWIEVGTSEHPIFQFNTSSFIGTLHVKVVPTGVTGMKGDWDDAPTASATIIPTPYMHIASIPSTGELWRFDEHYNGSRGSEPVTGSQGYNIEYGVGKFGNAAYFTRALTNEIDDANDMDNTDTWTYSAGLLSSATAPSGLTHHLAWTLTDDNAGATENTTCTITHDAGANTYTFSLWIKKDTVTSRFPRVVLSGAPGTMAINVNTFSGATDTVTSSWAPDDVYVVDGVRWWQLNIELTTGAGQTTTTLTIYPAPTATFDASGDTAALTGSVTIYNPQMLLNVTWQPPTVVTSTAASVLEYPRTIWNVDAGTVAFWLYVHDGAPHGTLASPASVGFVIDDEGLLGNAIRLSKGVNSTTWQIQTNASDPADYTYLTIMDDPAPGWHFLAATWHKADTELHTYLDGVAVASSYTANLPETFVSTTSTSFFIGSGYAGTHQVDTLIDNFLVIPKVLSPLAISSLYYAGVPFFDLFGEVHSGTSKNLVTVADNFAGVLGTSDTTVQIALETLDAHTHAGYTEGTESTLTYYVDSTGDDDTGDGSSGSPWETVTYALSQIPNVLNHDVEIRITSNLTAGFDVSGFNNGNPTAYMMLTITGYNATTRTIASSSARPIRVFNNTAPIKLAYLEPESSSASQHYDIFVAQNAAPVWVSQCELNQGTGGGAATSVGVYASLATVIVDDATESSACNVGFQADQGGRIFHDGNTVGTTPTSVTDSGYIAVGGYSETGTTSDTFTLNNDAATGANASLLVERGSTGADAALKWNETDDVWEAGLVGSEEEITTHTTGTWPPTHANLTLTTAVGHYIDMGDWVFVGGKVVWASNGTAYDLDFGGLPFAPDDATVNNWPGAVRVQYVTFTENLVSAVYETGGDGRFALFDNRSDALAAYAKNQTGAAGAIWMSAFYKKA